jgi:hypothetical protein
MSSQTLTVEEQEWEAEYNKLMKISNATMCAEEEHKNKGALCSVSGGNYEKKIYKVVQQCNINGVKFNTQPEEELGGSSSNNDVECNYTGSRDIGIEAKKYKTPDWMQCSIIYNEETKKWEGSKKCKIPPKSRDIFIQLIKDYNIFDGDIPPFMQKPITHEEWLQIKKDTKKWDDQYFDISNDIIRKLYREKGCQYIQISDGYGLYHLGEDICNFSVPIFDIEQRLRIRTKIHTRKNKKGFCSLSVTIAAQPKNIKKLNKSTYSLDDRDKLPGKLVYDPTQ